MTKECVRCHQVKDKKEFAKNSKGATLSICRECMKREKPSGELVDKWGTSPIYAGIVMTDEIYSELEEFYENKVKEFKGQTLTDTQRATIMDATKMRVAARHLMSKGNEAYTKLVKTSEELLASEQLRKKDERPVEAFRIDSQIKALEDAGFVENGIFLNAEETAKVISEKFACKRKYDYSIDVCDDVLLDILNCIRQNEDEPILSSLPDELLQEDIHGEFSPEETEEEVKRKRYAGLTSNRK